MRTSLIILVVVVLSACRGETRASEDAGEASAARRGGDDAGWRLTDAKVLAWLGLQRALQQAAVLDRRDAGARSPRAELLRRARLERDLRVDAGLGEAEVDLLEDLVSAVAVQRGLVRLASGELAQEFESAALGVENPHRKPAASALTQAKTRFGEDNVRVVLAHEVEVSKAWEALLGPAPQRARSLPRASPHVYPHVTTSWRERVMRVGSGGQVDQRASVPAAEAARFELRGRITTKVAEASDVAALPGGRFVVVSDTSDTAQVVNVDGSLTPVKLPGIPDGDSQLEGVAYDPVRKHLLVVREEAHELRRYEWDPDSKRPPKLEKVFSLDYQGPKNKGFEGIAYLRADQSPQKVPQLLLAKEGQPRELWLHDDGGRETKSKVELEKEVFTACKDFSAVAVDPLTGHIFISSDESATCVQVRLVRDGQKVRGELVQAFPLRDEAGKALKRVEGLTFDQDGNLYVLTENDGLLRRLKRR
jgi:uncharacterized protein YjiK